CGSRRHATRPRRAGPPDHGGVSLGISSRLLRRDNDRAYGHAFRSRVRAMGIRDRPISPRSPWRSPYVECLICTVRRGCVDRVLVFGEAHLRQILSCYAAYYNEVRLADGRLTPPQEQQSSCPLVRRTHIGKLSKAVT